MRPKSEAIFLSVVSFVFSVALWLGLVFVGRSPELRQLYNPQAFSRALGGSIGLVILSGGALLSKFRGRPGTSEHYLSLSAVAPLVLLGVLFIPATRAGAPAPAGLLFDRPPAEASLLPNLPIQATNNVPITGGPLIPADSVESDADWVADDGGALQDAVSALLGEQSADSADSTELIPTTGTISVSDAQYSRVMDLLWDDPTAYTGRTLELEGMVYRQRAWPGDTIVVARLSIWCCIDDAAVVGLLAELPPGDLPPEDLWIRATGTLEIRESFDTGSVEMRGVPVLRDVQWTSAPEPSFPYVFPVNW